MCVSPVKIPNPNYGNKLPLMRKMYDCENQYLNVPCGVCDECLHSRQMQVVQRARVMALDHYIFFCTLTYNNESLPYHVCSNGYKIPFVAVSDLQNMFKRIRNGNLFTRPFSYFFVSERGSERGRPHVHGLIFIKKKDTDDPLYPAQLEPVVRNVVFREWRRNYGSHRCPVWRPLFTYRSKFVSGKLYKNFDVHYVVPHATEEGSSDVAFYVTKYVLKPNVKERSLQQALSLNLSAEEYNEVWSKVKSRSICSKGFGSKSLKQENYVKDCIVNSQDDPDGFKFYTEKGESQPLARYYRKFITLDNAVRSSEARQSPLTVDTRSVSEKDMSIERGSVIRSKVSNREISDLFSDL